MKLIAISIGPVQEFILAARRTRDLWYGSHLLSELSKAAAQAVEKHGKLIFPATSSADSVANIVLAELNPGADPGAVAKAAKEAVQGKWEKVSGEVLSGCGASVSEDLWRKQVKDAIEIYSAWVDGAGDYKHARSRLMALLGARKACRDFVQSDGSGRGIPKSSLDGRRESVRAGTKDVPGAKLAKGEELCAIGMTKRLAGGKVQYPSVARIAADPWLRGQQGNKSFGRFAEACKELRDAGMLTGISSKYPQYSSFPFDASVVYPDRHTELHDDEKQLLKMKSALTALNAPTPTPYLAILSADGDRMGEAISAIANPDAHRDFSAKLAGFASAAPKIVADHSGVCVYSGGDDVFALLPADKSVECARALRDLFKQRMGGGVTLSVGVAVGHFIEPLEDLRLYAQAAEKLAKGGGRDSRYGFSLQVFPRGGSEFGVRAQWTEDESALDRRILYWAGLFLNGELPNKFPYDLRELGAAFKARPKEAPACKEAIIAEAMLLLKRKQVKKSLLPEIEAKISGCDTADKLIELAAEMMAAQWIGTAKRQAEGK